jgi:hypothetical protein
MERLDLKFRRSDVRYMFLIYSQEADEPLSPEDLDQIANGHRAVMADAGQKGILRGVERLKPTRTATTIRVKNGVPVTIDGPFAETKEQLAGYYILDCKDLDEAIEWGKRIPTACRGREGSIEIRPVDNLESPIRT